MTREDAQDAQAAAAFDGPSTPEERLRYRIGGAAFDLYVMGQKQTDPNVMIAKAREVIALASRLKLLQ